MDRKRGIAFILSLIVVMIISIVFAYFFYGAVNESRLSVRHLQSARAFWLAEAGLAQALSNMPSSVSGTLGGANYSYSASSSLLQGQYYQIQSTGSVQIPGSGSLSRTLTAVVRTDPVDPNNFQHAIRTTAELVVKGSVDINGPQEEFASLNFPDLFEHSKEEMKALADTVYTNPPGDVTPVSGLTWVELTPGNEFRVSSNGWTGSGILIVSGDAFITGGTFNGIVYVIGKLRMSGNPIINGTILAESSTEIDTVLTGNVTLNYDQQKIIDALSGLQFISPIVVSWKES